MTLVYAASNDFFSRGGVRPVTPALRCWLRGKLLDVLSGLEVGIIGGLVALAWYMVFPLVLAKPWWWIPNLHASKHYEWRHITAGAGAATFAGSAVHLIMCGVLGGAAGFFGIRGRVAGPVLAAVWFALLYAALWDHIAPLVPQAPAAVIAAGQFLFGSALGWRPAFRKRLEEHEAPAG